MKNTLLAIFAAFAVTAGAAAADDFNNIGASVTAEFGRFELSVEGTEDNGYSELSFGANVLSYDLSDAVTAELDVFAAHYDDADAYGLGAEYTMTYTVNAFSAWGAGEVEYVGATGDFSNGEVLVTPTVGAGYAVTEAVSVWGEVGYTWVATNDWARAGGVAELGVDFALADNVTFTPSVVRTFDTGADETQMNLGLHFSF